MSLGTRLFRAYIVLVFIYMAAPIVIVAFSSVTRSGYLTFPPDGFSLEWYAEFLKNRSWITAAKNSFLLALYSTLISLGLGSAAAFAVAWRRPWQGSGVYSALMVLPLAFPFTATGIAVVGTLQAWKLMGTFPGFLVSHILITLPYTYRAVLGSIHGLHPSYYEAALMHGANEWRAFWRVVVPLLRPGLVSGFIFSYLLSFDEVTISMLLVGPFYNTLPVKIFSHILESADPMVAAVSTLQVIAVGAILLVTERIFGLRLFTESY